MTRALYTLNRDCLFEVGQMYGDEIQISAIRPLTFDVYLTEGQVEELNAIEIFPRPYE